MNWLELKSKCIDQVASEIAWTRVGPGHNALPSDQRFANYFAKRKEAEPEAIEKIKAMNGLELIDLISEVVGDQP